MERITNCSQCEAPCCSYLIHLSASDCLRLSNILDLSIENFFNKYVGINGCLKKQNKQCPFLSNDKKCLYYNHRPDACRYYLCQETDIPSINKYTAEDLLNIVSQVMSQEEFTRDESFLKYFENYDIFHPFEAMSLALTLSPNNLYFVFIELGMGKLVDPVRFRSTYV